MLFIFASISLACQGVNPIKEFPSAHKVPLLIRVIAGQSVFYLYFIAVRNAPLTLITTIARTDAFWILIMGLLINGEKIILIEAIGIVVCFSTIFAMFKYNPVESEDSEKMDGVTFGMCVGTFSAFVNGTGTTMTRTLKAVPASIILWYYGLFGIVTTGIYVAG